jgi:hypothetical protein
MAVINFNHTLDPRWSEFTPIDSRRPNNLHDAHISTKANFPPFRMGLRDHVFKVISMDINMYVDVTESWVVKGTQSAHLLAHEQGHYDIAAIGNRELNEGILALTGTDIKDLTEKKSAFTAAMQRKLNQKMLDYDAQTDHGNNSTSQQLWETRIGTTKLNPKGTLQDLP